jgi:hypothetical protein
MSCLQVLCGGPDCAYRSTRARKAGSGLLLRGCRYSSTGVGCTKVVSPRLASHISSCFKTSKSSKRGTHVFLFPALCLSLGYTSVYNADMSYMCVYVSRCVCARGRWGRCHARFMSASWVWYMTPIQPNFYQHLIPIHSFIQVSSLRLPRRKETVH